MPDEQWFEDWRNLITELDDAAPVFKGRNLEESLDKQLEDVREYAENLICYREAAFDRLNDTSIVRWLGENGLDRTYARMHGKHRWSPAEARDRAFNSIVDMLMGDYTRISLWSYQPKRAWISGFIEAYREYLFRDHDAVYRAQKVFQANMQRINALLDEIRPYVEDRGLSLRRMGIDLERLERIAPTTLPRNSKLKAEQRFVQRMVKVNRAYFGSPKPDKIADLMTLPGFQHQFDARHIARLCQPKKGGKSDAEI